MGFTLSREVGNEILTVENLSSSLDGKVLFKDMSFRIDKDDKIAFIGNDVAITRFFEIITGNCDDYEGNYKWGQTITMRYFPRDNSDYFDGRDENLVDWLRNYSEDQSEIVMRSLLGRMLFSGDEVLKKVNVLSGGERVRMMFSKMMIDPSNVLIFDQPTNHLDLESIESVNNGLIDYKSNVLFTAHDHQFISSIANRIIEIRDDGTVFDVKTDYEDFIERYIVESNEGLN